MRTEDTYDVLIIGAGQAGIPLAHALAKAGKRTALAERKDLGGSCVNFGCTPTKAAIASARTAFQARRAAQFGIRVSGVEVDFPAVLDRARSILMQSRASLRRGLETTDNPLLVRGHARLAGREAGRFRVIVGEKTFGARQVVLDTGTRSLLPSIEGLRKGQFLHAGNWLDAAELPEHILFVGGGYIALEMSQFYRRMGSRVTVTDGADQILKREDADVVFPLQRLLESEGIAFRLNSRVTRASWRGKGVTLSLRSGRDSSQLRGSHLFVAAGRKPNTDDLGLETVGVRVGADGVVATDEKLATNVPGIWAAGDIRGGPMFTHTAWDDFRILESQMAGDGSRTTRRVVPYAVYTDPELGRVGKTEKEAREAGADVRIGRFEMRNNGKARELSETEGFIKVIVESGSKKILGASVLSFEGAELVHLYGTLMNADLPYTVLRDAVHIHPTLAEAVQSAVSSLP